MKSCASIHLVIVLLACLAPLRAAESKPNIVVDYMGGLLRPFYQPF